MSYIDTSTSSQLVATLTRRGRELLSTNSIAFSITKFAFGDDEINYADYIGDSPDADNSQILATPILESTTNGSVALRWGLSSLPFGTTTVAGIIINPTRPTVDQTTGATVSVHITTLRGYDAAYYLSSNSNFVKFSNNTTNIMINSYRDTNQFDNFQNQSAADFYISFDKSLGSSNILQSTITIKGANTGANLVVPVRILALRSQIDQDPVSQKSPNITVENNEEL